MTSNNIKPTLLIFFICVFVFLSGNGQTTQKRRPFCGFSLKGSGGYYYQEEPQEYITREAKPGDRSGIPDVVEEIKKQIGVDVEIAVFISKDEDNCFATIAAGGKRMIIADHLFLNRVNKMAGTEWAAISIIAHEIGHHVAGFSRRPKQTDSELDADYWSGYVLQKLGAGKDASIKCIMTFGTDYDTSSHPNRYSRAATIKKGWEDAETGKLDSDRCESCD